MGKYSNGTIVDFRIIKINKMKKTIQLFIAIGVLLISNIGVAQAYKAGEELQYQVSYGLVNAGKASISLSSTNYNGKKLLLATGKGSTTGMTKWFFEVDDTYKSYFDPETGRVYRYIRKVDEGGHIKDEEGFFDHASKKAKVKDYEDNKEYNVNLSDELSQDMLSALFYLRNHPDIDTLKAGEMITINMFFDRENYKFKLKFIGKEKISTKFGKINALKFKPYVQAGRVFKEKESVTVWVSDDQNKVPVQVEAKLMVGSLKAKLISYKGLQQKL